MENLRKVSMILIILVLTSCSNPKKELDNIYSSYLEFKTNVEEEANTLSNEDNSIEAFKENKLLDLQDNNLFEFNKYYDIQGNPKNNIDQSIRETIAYQRFLGHLAFFSDLEQVEGKIYLKTIVKIMNKDPWEFIGINELYTPLQLFKDTIELPENKKVLIIDPGKNIVELNSLNTYQFDKYSENLTKLIREASLLEQKEEEIELTDNGIEGSYKYKTGDGFVIAIQID